MAIRLILLCVVMSFLLGHASQSKHINGDLQLLNQLQEAKLKVAQLESLLDDAIRKIDAGSQYLSELENSIQETENQIQHLHSMLFSIKGDSSSNDARISRLEGEVKVLWGASRGNNFDIHVLESKARDVDDTVEVLASEVEKMSDIVTERWIHIQLLEQMREFNARRHLKPTKCTFVKQFRSIRGLLNSYSQREKPVLKSILTQVVQELKNIWSAFRNYHHKLQALLKDEMEKTELTTPLANNEVVFFLASALITFPVLGAWMLH